MARRAQIVVGDGKPTVVTLQNDNGSVRDISTASTVRMAVVRDTKSGELLLGPLEVLAGDPGNDWSVGVVAGAFDPVQMAGTEGGDYELQVSWWAPERESAFGSIELLRGGLDAAE